MQQSIVSVRPDDGINVEEVPGHVIVMSHGTVIAVLAGDREPEDHSDIVNTVVHALTSSVPSPKAEDLTDQIYNLRSRLDESEMAFLEQKGWKHTSSTPDFMWRWVKRLSNGTEIMTNKADALRMEGIT